MVCKRALKNGRRGTTLNVGELTPWGRKKRYTWRTGDYTQCGELQRGVRKDTKHGGRGITLSVGELQHGVGRTLKTAGGEIHSMWGSYSEV